MIVVLLSVHISGSIAMASPAYRGSVAVEEPDGRILQIQVHGDEWFNYTTTADGYVVERQSDGFHYLVDSTLSATKLRARDAASVEVAALRKTSEIIKGEYLERNRERFLDKGARIPSLRAGRFPTHGSPRALVILVEFSDLGFQSATPKTDYEDMLNGENYTYNGAMGSCRKYYSDNSVGQFEPVFDVYGPVELERDYRYYGQNNPLTGSDLHAGDMVIEACRAMEGEIDFSVYDTDGDGVIDNVYVFYAGYGAADSGQPDRIWPHSYDLSRDERRVVVGGKRLGNYACSNEINYNTGRMTGIGTFVHEFGHCLGLPDMYNTVSQSASFTPGEWDFMDYGMYNNQMRTPPCSSAYERFFLGWMEPAELIEPENLSLSPISENNAYIIRTNSADEYFLLENRQPAGWDSYIPGHGMLVWHIDYNKNVWDENRVNSNPSHQYVDIEEADNQRDLSSMAGDAFPGSANVTAITDDSQPNLRTWTGLGFGKTVTDIAESDDGVITFRFRGGSSIAGAPVAREATGITPTSFVGVWDKVEGATHYLVTVVGKEDGMPVGRYEDMDVGDVADFTFENLEPSTTYLFSVKGADSYSRTVSSNVIEIETLPPTFDLISPDAPEVTDITENSALVRIAGVAGADAYLLSVYTKSRGEASERETLDFSDGAVMPEGWLSSATSTISMNGYYGGAAPALSLTADGMFLQTPQGDSDITGFSMWMRGRSDVALNSLSVFGNDGLRWRNLEEFTIPSEGGVVALDPDLLEGIRAVRMVYNKAGSPGNAIIDDVTVERGASLARDYLQGYNRGDIGAGTEITVTDLSPGTTYYCRITATNGLLETRPSAECRFRTTGDSHIEETSGDGDISLVVDGGDLTVFVGSDLPARVDIYSTCGMLVATEAACRDKPACFSMLAPGLYLVRAGSKAVKIVF